MNRALATVGIVVAILAVSIVSTTFVLRHQPLGSSSSSTSSDTTSSISISSTTLSHVTTQASFSSTSTTTSSVTTSTSTTSPFDWISPTSQVTYNGYANVTACISYPETDLFMVHLIAPNGTTVYEDAAVPNTQDGFTFQNNTWCTSYNFGQEPRPRLDVQGIWTVTVLFSTENAGYKASATIDYV